MGGDGGGALSARRGATGPNRRCCQERRMAQLTLSGWDFCNGLQFFGKRTGVGGGNSPLENLGEEAFSVCSQQRRK